MPAKKFWLVAAVALLIIGGALALNNHFGAPSLRIEGKPGMYYFYAEW